MGVLTRTSEHITADRVENETPFLLQVTMMTWRNLKVIFRTPEAVIPTLIISAFFLFVYEASLGNAAEFLPGLSDGQYLAFILPLSVVSAALSGSSVAGQTLVRDIESGYFDKLLLTPVSRIALLSGPVLAGAVILAMQTSLIVGIALLMGLESATGILGILAMIGFALLLGTGFAGFTVAVALRTGNAAATSGASFAFFPLTFLTASFVPLDLLGSWLKTAAKVNPITYILEATRSVLLTGWDVETLIAGLLACAVLGIIPFIFALLALKSRTARK